LEAHAELADSKRTDYDHSTDCQEISAASRSHSIAKSAIEWGTRQLWATRQILYEVLDGSGAVLPAANMFVQESLSFISNGCNLPNPNQTNGLTNSDGSFPDTDKIQACSPKCLPADKNLNPTGSCTTTSAQTWAANGYTVKSATITLTCPGPPTGVP